ncbi:MAG: sensor histidine kinase [Solirubrobacterales bacterium]|nr:sensor histidine kinase [Solirubrobacterales bacterium]
MSLLWRVFAVNAAVVVAAAVALVATPATVSDPVATTEVVVVVLGIVAILVVNLVLLRRVLEPVRRVAAFARGVQPLRPGGRADVPAAEGEARELAVAVNEMLDRLEAERRDSARRALSAQEAERLRIARELHDEVGQVLTAVVLTLQRAGRDAGPDVAPVLDEAREDVRAALDEVRAIAGRLRPEALDDLGLRSALAALTVEVERASGITVRRSVPAALPDLPDDVELVVYRVAQEALTNVARHADARTASLALAADPDELRLEVVDDGRGLPRDAEDGKGLLGMRERAVLVGGEVEVGPAPGGGTRVALRVPR